MQTDVSTGSKYFALSDIAKEEDGDVGNVPVCAEFAIARAWRERVGL